MANADNRQQDPRERKGEKNETIDFSFALASLDDEKAAVCVFNEYTKKMYTSGLFKMIECFML